MKGIVGLIEPLLVKQESAHIGDRFAFRLDGPIANALHRPISVSDNHAEAPPLPSA